MTRKFVKRSILKKKKNPGEIKVKLYYSIYEMIDAVDLNN